MSDGTIQITLGGDGGSPSDRGVSREYIIERLGEFCDEKLPEKASEGGWPVRFDHCFRRLAYDAACGNEWYGCVDGDSFTQDAADEQLKRALTQAVRLYHDGPGYAWFLQEKSLLWRGEIQPGECEHVNPEEVDNVNHA